MKILPTKLLAVLLFLGFSGCSESSFSSSGSQGTDANGNNPSGADGNDPSSGDANGTSNSSNSANSSDSGDPAQNGGNGGNGGGPGSGGCVEADFVKLIFPTNIQACINEGKLWNFDSNQCTNIRKAATCNFDYLIGKMQQLELKNATQHLIEARDKKALLVGCGESADGHTFVPQWIFVPEEKRQECNYSKINGKVITACYKVFTGGQQPPVINNKEEELAYVLSCMVNL